MSNDVKENLPNSIEEIAKIAILSAKQVINEQKVRVLSAWKLVFLIGKDAECHGISALENQLEEYEKIRPPFYETIQAVIGMLAKSMDKAVIEEVMITDYIIHRQDSAAALIFSLYMRCVRNLGEITPEETAKEYLKLIPEEHREFFMQNRERTPMNMEFQINISDLQEALKEGLRKVIEENKGDD